MHSKGPRSLLNISINDYGEPLTLSYFNHTHPRLEFSIQNLITISTYALEEALNAEFPERIIPGSTTTDHIARYEAP